MERVLEKCKLMGRVLGNCRTHQSTENWRTYEEDSGKLDDLQSEYWDTLGCMGVLGREGFLEDYWRTV